MQPPPPMRAPSSNQGAEHIYCKYHHEHGHATEDCCHLKKDIEKLIERRHLKCFITRDRVPEEVNEEKKEPQQGATNEKY